jgi:hypothetical protein
MKTTYMSAVYYKMRHEAINYSQRQNYFKLIFNSLIQN